LTGGSLFLWGNCVENRDGIFLQGGSGYFMSRCTATALLRASGDYLANLTQPEDVAFTGLMERAGVSSMIRATSEFIMGQYTKPVRVEAMDTMDIAALPKCAAVRPAHGCRDFLERFNRVAVFHRLSRLEVVGRPRPAYEYPDNVYWFQDGEFSDLCVA
jgi:hypothetical protein